MNVHENDNLEDRVGLIAIAAGADLIEINATKTVEELETNKDVIAIANITGCSSKEVAEALKYMTERLVSAATVIVMACEGVRHFFEALSSTIHEVIEREENRSFYKLDFKRPKIQHQVACRRPRHLVKKIIR